MHTDDALPPALHPDDVVVVRWPEQRADAERLARLERPRLLLVEPGVPPPQLDGCLADWIRLPADDIDVRARLSALSARARQHPSVPVLDGYGELASRGRRVYLSPTDQRLISILVDSFDKGVPERELFNRIWDDAGESSKVRVQVSRLR